MSEIIEVIINGQRFWKAATPVTSEYWRIAGILLPVVNGTEWNTDKAKKNDLMRYVSRCEMAGFAKTDDQIAACARRYMAGKRKVSPAGASRRKRAEKELRVFLANPPLGVLEAVSMACTESAVAQYKAGNEKSINAIVGKASKATGANPRAIKVLIEKHINERLT